NQLASTNNSNFIFTTDLAMSADGATLLAVTTVGVFRSIDGGASFQSVLFGINAQDVKFLSGSRSDAVVGGRVRTAYWWGDGGATWTVASGLAPCVGCTQRIELGMSVSSPNVVYASVDAGGTSSTPPAELWQSSDDGHSYAQVSVPSSSLLGAQ